MKTVVIFCASLQFPGETFEKESYWEAYSDLLLSLRDRGVRAYFAADNATYLGDGLFSEAYTFSKHVRPVEMQRECDVRADLVYDRGGFAGEDIRVMNPKEITLLGNDKRLMYEIFEKFQPFSATCYDRAELDRALQQIKTDRVVVKDPTGYGGAGVHIGTREEVLKKIKGADYPLLAQEFMDTSVGIPGIVEGVHDLRLELVGGKIAACYIRSPKKGELRANVALGGTARYLSMDEIPARAVYLSKRIDAYFRGLPRHYAIDFARSARGWKLIELNARPGLTPYSDGYANVRAMAMLADYIVKMAKGKHHWLHLPSLNLPGLRTKPADQPDA
jgi:glutathione synthase/RimK-type ligase-like ATP-grasp enzyme